MAQSRQLVQTLKRALRTAQITYADIARHLDMSEANVKRLFATHSFTLQRIESICELMHMDLADLFNLLESERQRIQRLTLQQEKELVANTGLLLVAVCVRNQIGFDEIVQRYRLTEAETIRHLAHLDRLGIIDLLPGNRFKLLIDDNFEWLTDGPIERFYQQQIQKPFLDARFDAETELRQFQFALLSASNCRAMVRRLRDVAREFTEMHKADAHLPLGERNTTGLLIALRPWELDVFEPFRLQQQGESNPENSSSP